MTGLYFGFQWNLSVIVTTEHGSLGASLYINLDLMDLLTECGHHVDRRSRKSLFRLLVFPTLDLLVNRLHVEKLNWFRGLADWRC